MIVTRFSLDTASMSAFADKGAVLKKASAQAYFWYWFSYGVPMADA
ncbi:hypothetical protein GPM19_03755 [Halomonas sp. ZH2S]|uniref:Uncharacterized protein n=1 Tax=Vreelandella zhuhanensis TaxID=2684210 RepID=A0A7X3KPX9_9GAMM|nr:hypothetical protein [Halomonas zhuhanensis]MWJ27328.1 hypothetical protein [Halomonas zhuhanensis]